MLNERDYMVRAHLIERGIRDQAVIGAMRNVPRDAFITGDASRFAYSDTALPIEEGQTISQPYIVAFMAEALRLDKTSRVLEVGLGSGYAAAVLSRIAADVYAMDRHPSLVALAQERFARLGYNNIHVQAGNGAFGWPEHAPYQGISVAAAASDAPPPLLRQLSIGGRLVMPIGSLGTQMLTVIVRTDERVFDRTPLCEVRFVPLL